MNENEMLIEQPSAEEAQDAAVEQSAAAEQQPSELEQLRADLRTAQLKAELLLGGAARERLEEALGFAERFCEGGRAPAEAAAAALTEYPHLKTVARELPKMAAPSGGALDGFAEIRKIFAGAMR